MGRLFGATRGPYQGGLQQQHIQNSRCSFNGKTRTHGRKYGASSFPLSSVRPLYTSSAAFSSPPNFGPCTLQRRASISRYKCLMRFSCVCVCICISSVSDFVHRQRNVRVSSIFSTFCLCEMKPTFVSQRSMMEKVQLHFVQTERRESRSESY